MNNKSFMRNKILTKRLIVNSIALILTLSFALITDKDGPKYRPTPSIPVNYLLTGDYSNSNDIFDYYDIGNNEYAVALNDNYTSGTINVPSVHPSDGKKVTGIWHNAFHNCSATTINLTTNITVIDYEAFLYSGITSIEIPYSVNQIGDAAFYSCNRLTTVTFINSSQDSTASATTCDCDEEEPKDWYCDDCDKYFTLTEVTESHICPDCGEEVEQIEIRYQYSTLKKIPSYCFFKCQALAEVRFPASIEEVCEEAFNGCAALVTPLSFMNIKIIRSKAFQGCSALTVVYISKSLFEDANGAGIEPHAFNYCDSALEFHFCGTTEKIGAWITNHPNWGWFNDYGDPSLSANKYTIYIQETGEAYYSSDWSYTVDANNEATITSYNGEVPTSSTGWFISVPDELSTADGHAKVVRINKDAFPTAVKTALRRLYLPTTLVYIENTMFKSGYDKLYVIDDNTACTTDENDRSAITGRINLSGLKNLEFIGVHAFAGSKAGIGTSTEGGIQFRNRITKIHLPANLIAIGDEAFGVFGQRIFRKVTEFIWDYNESTSQLETIGTDCFYAVGIDESVNAGTQINNNIDWKEHTSTTVVFPKTFKYFGITQADENRYIARPYHPFNFNLYNGDREKAEKWERPSHAFAGCSLIKAAIFKGSNDPSLTTDLIIPLQTFVFNESLQTIVFEERNGHSIAFHTQQGNGSNRNNYEDFAQESIGANASRGKNDFRGEPFLQTIVLPNVNTQLYFQHFALHGNSRATIYLSGTYGTNMYADATRYTWTEMTTGTYSWQTNPVDDATNGAKQWRKIGNESWYGAKHNPKYYGYVFNGNASSNTTSNNTFSIDQDIPVYENVYYSKSFPLETGSVSVSVGNSASGNKYTEANNCSFVCGPDAELGINAATMTNYLYNIKDTSRSDAEKITCRVPDSVTVGGTVYPVKRIGDSAFSACFCDSEKDGSIGNIGTFPDLRAVELPDCIYSIGEYAFIRTYGLAKISAYTSGNAPATDYEMPSSLRHIGKNAFLFCAVEKVLKIPVDCRFYENEHAEYNITSVFANCVNLRKITFTTTANRSNEVTYTDYYETTTYTSTLSGTPTYTCALYAKAGVAYNNNRLLLVLNRDIADKKQASADATQVLDNGTPVGLKFDGLYGANYKDNPFLYGAYKMGYWIKELKYGNSTTDDGTTSGTAYTQPLICAVGKRANNNSTLTFGDKDTFIYLGENGKVFTDLMCNLDTISGQVLELPKYALKGCENLKTVELPNKTGGVVPEGVFEEATGADFVTDGTEGHDDGVLDLSGTGYSKVSKNSFKGNTKITKLIAPSNSFVIDESAFQNCTNLATLDLSKVTGTLTINKNAFASSGVSSITWPAAPCVIKIENDGAFSSCNNLTNLVLPPNLSNTLGSNTFQNCTSLTSVTVNGESIGVTTFNTGVFRNCGNLTSFEFEKFTSLTTIGESAFYNVGSMAVTLPESVTTVKKTAFSTSDITSITFKSNNSIKFEDSVFEACTSLTAVRFKNHGISWSNTYSKSVFNGCTSLTELQLPTGFSLTNNNYNGTTTFLIQNDTLVNIYTYTKFTSTTTATSGWRSISSGNEKPVYYFVESVTDLVDGTIIDNTPSVLKGTVNLWTVDANGHAINLGTVTAYNGTTVTFSSGYTLTGSSFVAP